MGCSVQSMLHSPVSSRSTSARLLQLGIAGHAYLLLLLLLLLTLIQFLDGDATHPDSAPPEAGERLSRHRPYRPRDPHVCAGDGQRLAGHRHGVRYLHHHHGIALWGRRVYGKRGGES
eukprot:752602-Hanusia_phi.AAC.2